MVGKGNQMFQRDNSHSETENSSKDRSSAPFVSGTKSIRTFRSFLFDNMRLMTDMVTYRCNPSTWGEGKRTVWDAWDPKGGNKQSKFLHKVTPEQDSHTLPAWLWNYRLCKDSLAHFCRGHVVHTQVTHHRGVLMWEPFWDPKLRLDHEVSLFLTFCLSFFLLSTG